MRKNIRKINIVALSFIFTIFLSIYLLPVVFAAGDTPLNLTVVSPGSETPVVNESFKGTFGGNVSVDLSGLASTNQEVAFSIFNGEKKDGLNQSFLISGSTNVVVVVKVQGTKATAYVDSNGKFLAVKYGDTNTFTPTNLTKPGYVWSGWQADASNDVNNQLFVAKYTRTGQAASVPINIVDGSADVSEPQFNEVVTLTPNSTTNFAYWADEDGKVVSTSPNYTFSAIPQKGKTNIYLKAVHDASFVKLPSVYLNDVSGIRSGYQSMLGYVNNPNGYTLVEYGVLASDSLEKFSLDSNIGVSRIPSSALSPNNEFLRSFSNGTYKTFRAYAILLDGGEEVVVYSEYKYTQVRETFDVEFALNNEPNAGANFTFNEGNKTYEWATGGDEAWDNRLETNQPQIKQYDYMIFELKLTEILTGNMVLWMDMLDGDINTIFFSPLGAERVNTRLYVFNSSNERVFGGLNNIETYTFVIKLKHDDTFGRYGIGIDQNTNASIMNPIAVKQTYIETHYDISELETFDLEFKHGETIANGSVIYDEETNAYNWITGGTDGAWDNRIQSSQSEIKQYDYMIFELKLSELLTSDLFLWMDTVAGEANTILLKPSGAGRVNGRLFIFNAANERVVGSLNANETYTFVIKLKYDDTEGRYGIGTNQNTSISIINPIVATKEYTESKFDLSDLPIDDTFNVIFDLTADNNVGATYEMIAPNTFYYNTGKAHSWSNRIETSQSEMKNYDYLVFDIALNKLQQGSIQFWMDMQSTDEGGIFELDKDGTTNAVNKIFVFNEQKELVSGALNIFPARYTIVIKLSHTADSRYAFGFNEITTVYIADAYATTAANIEFLFGIPQN